MGLRKLRCDTFLTLGLCLIASTVAVTVFLFDYLIHSCHLNSPIDSGIQGGRHSSSSAKHDFYETKTTPVIFIGGWPRSGTTLMRAMLDSHPSIRCGEETHLIPEILNRVMAYRNSTSGAERLLEAGITEEILFSATASFILEVIVRHAEPAARLCNKDPFTLGYATELSRMFPLGQFVLMIRDGRAVCYSMALRDIGIGGVDHKNMSNCLKSWNRSVTKMYSDCLALGALKCLPVYYEQLVLHPRYVLMKVLEFLGVSWNEVVLHHEDQINKPGGISLSRMEPSTDQVIKPINLDSLTKWANFTPEDLRSKMRQIAPMLQLLGYDPDAYPPNYGRPDKEVEDNTLLVHKNQVFFEQLAWKVRNESKLLGDKANGIVFIKGLGYTRQSISHRY